MTGDALTFEPFLHLAGLDDDQVLIAWGGFWFRPFDDGHGWRIVDDEQLSEIDPGRTDSIGMRSRPYGEAVVTVRDLDGRVAGTASTASANHAWVRGLQPATEYRYEVTVDGKPWAPAECRRWHKLSDDRGELRPAGRTYDCRFRTFPEPGAAEHVRFLAFGDYGVGIQTGREDGDHQRRLAGLMERLLDRPGIDFVVTLGDNIYHEEEHSVGGSGSEDDDWYFSFYEPYRFLISRVPLYPSVGNHDSDETEDSDDRDQLADNHYTDLRFRASVESDRSIVDIDDADAAAPGLFYRFSYGRLVELVSIDTSETGWEGADRFFDADSHRPFLDETFDPHRADRSRWLIPFGHHPPYCGGPAHGNDDAQLASLVPRYRRAGVRLVLAGHEHNFQHSRDGDIDFVVSGAAGKLRTAPPDRLQDARTQSWSAVPHVLVIEADDDELTVLPVAELDGAGDPVPLDARSTSGGAPAFPIRISAAR